MNEILVSPAAEAEMDDIWLYVARESHSIEIASRVVDAITAKFGLRRVIPPPDVSARILSQACEASPPMAT